MSSAREMLLEAHLKRMNDEYFIVREGGKTLIGSDEIDPVLGRKRLVYSTFTDIHQYEHQRIEVSEGEWVPLGRWWTDHPERRIYKGVVFSPGVEVPGYLNTWRGWAVEPRKGDWSLFHDHIFEVICRSDVDRFLYFLAWMADGVQRPGARPEVAVVLASPEKGTGKSFTVRLYSALFGSAAIQISHSRYLTGQFTSHLEDAVVVFLDEALWAGDKAAEGVLKQLITEEIIPVERKYCPVRFVRNHLHIILASNAEWIIPAGLDERRFAVFDVDPCRKQDHAYFAKIAQQMESGGLAAMLYDLQRHDYSNINLREAPKTDALFQQKLLSLDPRERWWFGKLTDGHLLPDDNGWSPEISKAALHEDYVRELKLTGIMRTRTATELGMWMEQMLGRRLTTVRPTMIGRRVRCWSLPPLQECRDIFDRATGSKHAWPAPEPAVPRSKVALMPGASR